MAVVIGRLRLFWWTVARAVLASVLLAAVGLAAVGVISVIGLPLVLIGLVVLRPLADLHRHRAGWLLGTPVPRPYLAAPTWRERRSLAPVLHDPALWRDLAWLLVSGPVGLVLCGMSISLLVLGLGGIAVAAIWTQAPTFAKGFGSPLGLADQIGSWLATSPSVILLLASAIVLAVWWVAAPTLMWIDAQLTRSLLAPTESSRLAIRVRELAESRAEAVDAQAAELRRIERDLHDGAQARLVALSMSLGLAEEVVVSDPAAARELIAEARVCSAQALAELRDVVRGIHPPVLADRGLAAAAEALALALALPVDIEIDVPSRLPAPVESAAYFAVAEALTNVVKHSGATRAWLTMSHSDSRLSIVVGDHGAGGADPRNGTGLRGIQRRLAAFDGALTVISPLGGPTAVMLELPCESLSPRTSPSYGTV